MAEEFVDLYEVLELPVDTDRNVLRKKINELYLEAQRNLDHRTFATRVKYQELFEVTLPQARYILLDEGRRDEYNRLVVASRAAKSGAPAPPPAPAAPAAAGGSFALVQEEPAIPDTNNSQIDAIPAAAVDPEKLAKEREELWNKWKVGLEEALGGEKKEDAPKARGATTAAPSSFSLPPQAEAESTSTPQAAAQTAPAPAPPPKPAPKPAPRKVEVNFDFDKAQQAPPTDTAASVVAGLIGDEQQLTPEEIESRRTVHRRQIMKDILVNVGIMWGAIGAAAVIVPGVAALVFTVGHYFPRNAAPLLRFSPNILWGAGFVVIAVAAYFVSSTLSKSMRRKRAQELSFLSYEDLLKQIGKS